MKCLAEASVVQNTGIKVKTAGSWQHDGLPLWGSWLWSSGAEKEGIGLNGNSVVQARKLNTRSNFFALHVTTRSPTLHADAHTFLLPFSLLPFSSCCIAMWCTSNEPHWFIFTITMVTFVPYSPPMMMHPNWTRHAEPACRQWRLFTALEHTTTIYSRQLQLLINSAPTLCSAGFQWCTVITGLKSTAGR